MNYMKHCDLLRQTCPEPMTCGNGCQCVKKDASDLPSVRFDKPWQWLQDLFYTAVYVAGSVVMGVILLAALVCVTGLHKVLF